MNKKSKKDKKNKESFWPLILLFVSVLLVWFAFGYFVKSRYVDWGIRGTFGDSFGGINSLFSGLAFGGIIYTILLQRKELYLQRLELKETRKELKRTANAQEKSNNFQLEQLRMGSMPIFSFDAKRRSITKPNFDSILIKNESKNVAFDINIWVVYIYNQEDCIKEEFIEEYSYLDKSELKNGTEVFKNEEWCVIEKGIYPVIFNNSLIDIPIENSGKIRKIKVYIQYRDRLNNNYSLNVNYEIPQIRYTYETTKVYDENEKTLLPFEVNDFHPKVLKVEKRIDFEEIENLEIIPDFFKELINYKTVALYSDELFLDEYIIPYQNWEIRKY